MIATATVEAPANIAFIKYWGARDLAQALPLNASVSMTLSECVSLSTVSFSDGSDEPDRIDIVADDGSLTLPDLRFRERALAHLERVRRWARRGGSFRVATRNSFPTGAGIASSASGFAALTLASTRALGLRLTSPELSTLARMSGSGSAARSVLGGYVLWPADGNAAGHAVPLAPASHWDLRDVIALVDQGEKDVPSLQGHRLAATSPHFETRQRVLPARVDAVKRAIEERDLAALGPVLEEEAIELHLIAMSSRPPIFYWKPGTVQVLETLRALRRDGVPAFATMDAGANVHVICEPPAEGLVVTALERIGSLRGVLLDGVGTGPRDRTEHLF
ncbi:MAG TPA: diphosphomevalonate decarboxylase [Candidatus Polarisedimenticolaceae bacterium]|nr:diphosphomevalonate decarboxylase [Candidatus Polarisedimenticolaceae bacterium]